MRRDPFDPYRVGNRELIEKNREAPYPISPGDLSTTIWYLWPNMIFTPIRQANPMSPRAADRAETSYRFVDHFFLNDPPSAVNAQMDGHRDVLAPQDRAAMEKQQLGIHALGYRQGRLM